MTNRPSSSSSPNPQDVKKTGGTTSAKKTAATTSPAKSPTPTQTVAAAKNLMRSRPTLIAAVMVARGEADALLTGIVGRFHKKLGYVRSVLPLEPKVTSTSAMTGVINQQGVFFFVDTHVQEKPLSIALREINEGKIVSREISEADFAPVTVEETAETSVSTDGAIDFSDQ